MGQRRGFASWVLACLAGLGMSAQAAEVIIGQVGPFSGLDAAQTQAYVTGMKLYFDAVNKTAGGKGHVFSLVSKDDAGSPEATVRLTKQLLTETRPMLLAGYFGDRNVTEVLKAGLLNAEKVTLIGYRASQIRLASPQLYSIRAALQDEIFKITEHLATIGISRIGLLYEDGPGAASLLALTDEAAKASKVSVSVKASFPSGTAKVTPAVDAFMKSAPQAIIMVCSGAVAASFIDQYRAVGGVAQLFASSGADVEQLARLLGDEQMQGVAIAQVVPNPYRVSTRLAKELHELIAKSGSQVAPSFALMEGFINAKVIVEAVRRAGAHPSRANFSQALQSIDDWDLGGYVISFKPGARSGSRFVDLSIVSGSGKIRQ